MYMKLPRQRTRQGEAQGPQFIVRFKGLRGPPPALTLEAYLPARRRLPCLSLPLPYMSVILYVPFCV